MKRKGFTLIELIVVIVILGILAVTAAPRFLNLQQDAKQAMLEGIRGAIASTVGITYSKLAIKGLEDEANVNGYMYPDIISGCGNDPGDSLTFCQFNYGYPQAGYATLPTIISGISPRVGEADWYIYGLGVTVDAEGVMFHIKITPSNNVNADGTVNDNCYLNYKNWQSRTDTTQAVPAPTIEIVNCD